MYQSHMLFHWHYIILKGVSLEYKSFHLWDTIFLALNTCATFTCMSRLTGLLGTIHIGQDGVLSSDVFSSGYFFSIFYVCSNNSHFHTIFFMYLQERSKDVIGFVFSGRRKDFYLTDGKKFLDFCPTFPQLMSFWFICAHLNFINKQMKKSND